MHSCKIEMKRNVVKIIHIVKDVNGEKYIYVCLYMPQMYINYLNKKY